MFSFSGQSLGKNRRVLDNPTLVHRERVARVGKGFHGFKNGYITALTQLSDNYGTRWR
jgi:hypothetical protein